MYSRELFKGTLKTLVLHLLREEGRMYGYQITQRVRQLSDGELELTEGALYPTLHKLEKAGLIVAEKERVGGRMRKYYRLSETGAASALDYVNEFQAFVRMMSRILQLKPE
ncbi:MAG: PadR family transcriptional regulator [Bacteroidota bacterium]